MQRQGNGVRACLALLVVAGGMLAMTGSAAAKLTGEFTKFEQCPAANPEVRKCIYTVSEGGEFAMGGAKMALVNPVTIQAGFTAQDEEGNASLVDAVNGVTMSKTSQPMPGGLLALASPTKTPALLQTLLKTFATSKLNQVKTTLELARPTSQVLINENNLAGEIGVGLTMPAKVHLENPLLGRGCYIGSSATPIMVGFTAGTTSPPPPNLPITGTAGLGELIEEGRILKLSDAVLVDNSFSVPKASGCGPLITPIINSRLGLPSPAGHNTMVMKSKVWQASALAVRHNNEENP